MEYFKYQGFINSTASFELPRLEDCSEKCLFKNIFVHIQVVSFRFAKIWMLIRVAHLHVKGIVLDEEIESGADLTTMIATIVTSQEIVTTHAGFTFRSKLRFLMEEVLMCSIAVQLEFQSDYNSLCNLC